MFAISHIQTNTCDDCQRVAKAKLPQLKEVEIFHLNEAKLEKICCQNLTLYRKIPIIRPGLIRNCSKRLFGGLIFGEDYFRRGLLLEGILRFNPI